MTETWPKVLKGVSGPMRDDVLEGAAAGMGEFGPETQALIGEGFLPPDMLCELTLFLLSSQPRNPSKKQEIPGGGGGVAGGVWVRERFTIHRPLLRNDAFSVHGFSVGRYVRKGRRYGVTTSETENSTGQRVATNTTIGLLAYKVQEGLEDGVEGGTLDGSPFDTDRVAARENPCREALCHLKTGQEFAASPVRVGLDLMKARDTDTPDNPIHSDPDLAKKAGLSQPIAGGSHILAFALEPILAALGRQSLFYGAYFDVKWKAPVYADAEIQPFARVMSADNDQVAIEYGVRLDSGADAMVGKVVVPTAG